MQVIIPTQDIIFTEKFIPELYTKRNKDFWNDEIPEPDVLEYSQSASQYAIAVGEYMKNKGARTSYISIPGTLIENGNLYVKPFSDTANTLDEIYLTSLENVRSVYLIASYDYHDRKYLIHYRERGNFQQKEGKVYPIGLHDSYPNGFPHIPFINLYFCVHFFETPKRYPTITAESSIMSNYKEIITGSSSHQILHKWIEDYQYNEKLETLEIRNGMVVNSLTFPKYIPSKHTQQDNNILNLRGINTIISFEGNPELERISLRKFKLKNTSLKNLEITATRDINIRNNEIYGNFSSIDTDNPNVIIIIDYGCMLSVNEIKYTLFSNLNITYSVRQHGGGSSKKSNNEDNNESNENIISTYERPQGTQIIETSSDGETKTLVATKDIQVKITNIGWKIGDYKNGDCLIQLEIPSDAKVSTTAHNSNGKVRCSNARVKAIYPFESKNNLAQVKKESISEAWSKHDSKFKYILNEIVTSKFNNDLSVQCSDGIHHFQQPELALNYWGNANTYKWV